MKRKYTDKELIGKKFYYLELLEPVRKIYCNATRIYWKCKCDCGKIIERLEKTIIAGDTQSCGCKHPRNNQQKDHTNWQGYEDISSQHFNAIKSRALKNNIEFNITIEQAWEKYIQQNRKCALTNLDISFATQRQQLKGKEQTASLDRIDSKKGYTVDNIQWLHKDVNIMKNDFDQKYFIQICKLISQE